MKKLFLGLAGIVMAANVWAADLKVGDKMPEVYGRMFTGGFHGIESWNNQAPYIDKKGDVIDPENFEYAFAVSLNCNQGVPFAVFSYRENEIYVDPNFNGKIDSVYNVKDSKEGEKMIKMMWPYLVALGKIEASSCN